MISPSGAAKNDNERIQNLVAGIKTDLKNAMTIAQIESFRKISPLHSAIQGGDLELVTVLLEKGADINSKKIVKIYKFIYGREKDITPLLFVFRCLHSFDSRYIQGYFENREDIICLLIKKGANDKVKLPSTEYDFLFTALQYCSLKIVKLLVEKGADLHDISWGRQKEKKGTAFHLAVRNEKHAYELMPYLVSQKLDINEPDLENKTPLLNTITNFSFSLSVLKSVLKTEPEVNIEILETVIEREEKEYLNEQERLEREEMAQVSFEDRYSWSSVLFGWKLQTDNLQKLKNYRFFPTDLCIELNVLAEPLLRTWCKESYGPSFYRNNVPMEIHLEITRIFLFSYFQEHTKDFYPKNYTFPEVAQYISSKFFIRKETDKILEQPDSLVICAPSIYCTIM